MTAPVVGLDPQRVLIAMPGCEAATMRLATPLSAELGHAAVSHFPDGESYVRLYTPVHGAEVAIVCTLGLFIPFAKVRAMKYRVEAMSMVVNGSLDNFVAGEQSQVGATGEGVADFMDLDLSL